MLYASCHSRRNVVTEAICLQATLILDYFATLVMTKTKMATRHKASRHDKLFFRDTRLRGFIETFCVRFLSLRDVLNARRGNLLASRTPHCVRDDNPELVTREET